jgi:hypothetical protein
MCAVRYHDSMGGGIKPIETLYRGYRFRSRLEARWAVFFDAAGIRWRYEEQGYDLRGVVLPNEPGGLEQAQGLYTKENPGVASDEELPRWYLPDFYLPKQRCWVEVKARRPSRTEAEKMARLVWGHRDSGYGDSAYIFWDLRPPKELQGSTSKETMRNVHQSALGARVIESPFEPFAAFPPDEKDELALLRMWMIQCFHLGIDHNDVNHGPAVTVDFDYQWCECPRCGFLGITSYGNARLLKCGCLVESAAERESLSLIDRAPVYTDDSPRLMAAYMAARQARFEHGEHPQQHVLQAKLDRIRDMLDSDN